MNESGPEQKGVYIQTFGCQMNAYDSAKMLEQLRVENYVPVASPHDAELILVNTCAVREKAEHKVYSLLGSLSGIKRSHPEMVIGVGGCVAQQKGEEILSRVQAVDLVFGTDNLFELPGLLKDVSEGRRVVRTAWHDRKKKVDNFIPELGFTPDTSDAVKAQIAITKGCNNFCSFCVVPYTRGREVSREPENIVAEATRLASLGVKEITLLGQNVNAYQANGVDFVGLLERLNAVRGLRRIRYTSPHPRHFDARLALAHKTLPAVCEHVHLPFQSGSDRILKAMRRNHTVEEYLGKTALIKALVPGITLSTDIIVGFPGEAEEDFQGTLEVLRRVRFDQIYAFKYSPRAQTPAARFEDQVPEAVRSERLARLFALQETIGGEINQALIGSRQEVLLEGGHPLGEGAMTGRSRSNKPVMVVDSGGKKGDLIVAEIIATRKFSLVGRGVSRED